MTGLPADPGPTSRGGSGPGHVESVEDLYLRFVSGTPSDAGFATLCAAHPAHAAALRNLHDDFDRARRALSPTAEHAAVSSDQLAAAVGEFDQPRTADAYQMATPLARGKDTHVEQVWDVRLRRPVARKVLRIDARRQDLTVAERARLQRFLAEGLGLSRLQHPGIPSIHDLGLDERGALFFTAPVVHGETFATVIARVRTGFDARWTRARALQALVQVCEAVSYAHGQGVAHGDLVPENLIAGRFGELAVLSWGRARWPTSALPMSDHGCALPAALASPPNRSGPGVAADSATASEIAGDQLADQAALGAILAQLVVGRRRIGDPAMDEVLTGHARTVALVTDSADAPELLSIGARATATDPGARYRSVAELAQDLRAFLERRVVQAHARGTLARVRAWARRNRVLAVASATAVVALCGGAAGVIAVRAREQASLRQARDALASEQAATARRLLELQTRTYANDLQTVQAILAEGRNLGQVRTLLDRCPPAWRGIEWRLVHCIADQSTRTFIISGAIETSLALSADGGLLVCGSNDARLRAWDTHSGAAILDVLTPAGIRGVALADDRRFIGLANGDWTVRLYDLTTGALVAESPTLGERQDQVAFTRDGHLVTVGNDLLVRVWGSPGLTLLRSFPTRVGNSSRMGLDASGELVGVVDYRGALAVLEVATGNCIYQANVPGEIGWTRPEFPIDRPEVWVIGSAGILRGDLAQGTTVLQPAPEGATAGSGSHLADGRRMAIQANTSIALFDAASMRRINTWHGHAASLCATVADPSPSGRWLYSADTSGAVKQWDLHHPVERQLTGPQSELVAIACAPDGHALVAATRTGHLWVWDLDRPDPPRPRDLGLGALASLEWTDVRTTVTTAHGESHAVDLGSLNSTPLRETSPPRAATDPRRIATADGTRILELGGARGDELAIRDAARGDVLLTLPLPTAGTCLALSANGRVLAAGLEDGRVAAWVLPR